VAKRCRLTFKAPSRLVGKALSFPAIVFVSLTDMKWIAYTLLFVCVLQAGFTSRHQENVEFVCMKTHKASNTCHFNFKIDGAKFRYVDIGCKYSKKTEEIIEKAKAGTIALSKDWKIECPEPKPETGH
jgi:hypothetical protein